MGSLMLNEIYILTKRFSTFTAFVSILFTVNLLMALKGGVPNEGFSTFKAFMEFSSTMDDLMSN